MWVIYTLTDPRDYVIRYVGVTDNPAIRFMSHISCSKGSQAKNAWIGDLKALGLVPLINIIDTAKTKGEAWRKEAFWIRYLSKFMPLTNKVYPSSIDFDHGFIDIALTASSVDYVLQQLRMRSQGLKFADLVEVWKPPAHAYTFISLSVYSGAWWHYTMRCARRFLEDHDIEAYRTLIPGCSWSVFGHDYCFCLPVKVEAQEPREEFSDAMSNAAEADDAWPD